MLQEATKILNSAFNDSFIKRLSLYLHDCVREEVKSSAFRNLSEDKENRWFFVDSKENLLNSSATELNLDGANSELTELMIQADISQKDRYLLYGYLFLKGKNPKRKRGNEFLTPLLYVPCRLERKGVNIVCSLVDDNISLNTGALSELLKLDDEDTSEHLLEGLVDVLPELPITQESLKIFLTTLKSIVPDVDITRVLEQEFEETNVQDSNSKLILTNTSAIVLTKRPTITAGLLHELMQMAEKPSGMFRETSLNVIQEEFSKSYKNKSRDEKKEIFPITPLDLSDSQKLAIEELQYNNIVTVCGPPGTGKSQTIVNLVAHLIASGKTVLVASRMDKAVDVVHDRLSGIGAPFLCLRAGRANYQKQLNFQLQDLLANKIDIDTGFESAILTSIDDLKKHFATQKELESKAADILKLENEWMKLFTEFHDENKLMQSEELIKISLNSLDIQECNVLLDKIEHCLNNKNIINSIKLAIDFKKLKKNLELSLEKPSLDIVDSLRRDISIKNVKSELKNIENSINKIGSLQQILQQLKELRAKHKTLAKDILKNQRRNALKSLTRDQYKRQSLMIHGKALVERRKNLQNKLLQDEDFSPLLEAFPCWAVTTYSISESLPLKPGLFDVAIIDEASQCDIASCFPVMFRAKKTVIVGDDKQLSHLSFLEKAKEQSFLSQYNIPNRYQLMWRFRTNSIFDVANFYSPNPILLDEHFRSLPPIINFSNKEFYGNRIKIINKEPDVSQSLELCVVKDAKVDLDSTRNMAEVEKIMEKLQDLISENNGTKPPSIGIVSPFRGQVELIKKAISQVLNSEIINRYKIEVGTAHTFQGDEKDIMLLSFAVAPNSHHQSIAFVQKPNLFNVAITRARKKLICFISRPPESLSDGLLKSYLEYIESFNTNNKKEIIKTYNTPEQKEMATLLEEEGIKVIPNFETAGYKVDFIALLEDKMVAVECDGFNEVDKQNYDIQIKKQAVLERCGWSVVRLTAREWVYSKKACINKIISQLNNYA